MTQQKNVASTITVVLAMVPIALVADAAERPGSISDAQGEPHQKITVNTGDGPVRGLIKNGVSTFLGIPYAAPPIEDLRWKAPVPPKRHEFIDATKFGKSCPQSNAIGVFAGPASVDEDCLYLNIFTAGVRPSTGQLKPVIVWFHGGGNFTGSSSDYDGSKLAMGGPHGTPSVVVTLNYRLGLLGFLAHSALMNEGGLFGNYGTLDQQAALRWIKTNIEAFGGDPNRVAVGGQSGGSVDVHANVVSPLSAGLLNRAIFQSAPAAMFVALDAAKGRGEAFAVAADCPGTDGITATCLRKLPVSRILQLQGTVNDNGPFLDPANQNVMVDGTIITMQPAEAYSSGKFNQMPVMGGTTQDELTFIIARNIYLSGPPEGSIFSPVAGPPQRALTPDDYVRSVNALYGPKAARVLGQYPLGKYGGDPAMAYNRVLADPIQCFANLQPLKVLASRVPTYGYIFTYQDAPFYFPKLPGFRPLASHTIDIQFLFTGFHGGILGVNIDQVTAKPRELNESEIQLSDRLIGFWTNFANTGNPNGSAATLWPKFEPRSPVFLQQDVPLATVTEAQVRARHNCAFWESN